ncbi:MAG: hypothetical protein DYG92_08420 [Leptolyngbya sp. PLA1]|nr:hypothetical protein [Leptolyngbya sp. PLA1]
MLRELAVLPADADLVKDLPSGISLPRLNRAACDPASVGHRKPDADLARSNLSEGPARIFHSRGKPFEGPARTNRGEQ